MTDRFSQIKKNTVSAADQLKNNENIKFENADGKGVRIMFAGNSITLHGIKEDIGWHGEWGMAASAKEKDYVHLLMSKTREKCEDAAFCICQVSEWETTYKDAKSTYEYFSEAVDFGADIVIFRFIENCYWKDFEPEIFEREYKDFIKYLTGGSAKAILTTGFWHHEGNDIIRKVALESALPFAELEDLGESNEMKAIGLFEHSGVANHPGDMGMKAIADRIWTELEGIIDETLRQSTRAS